MKRDLLRQAYGAMRHDLRKTLLTMLGMAWGIATVVLLLAYGDGFGQAIANIFESFGASAVGIVVPKKYLTEVGDDGFKKHPIGAGPYKFAGGRPGIEVDLEAFPDYWRRVPNVKTLVMLSVPEATTRALMVRTGEADIAYAVDGPDAESRVY